VELKTVVEVRQAVKKDIDIMWSFDHITQHDEKRRQFIAEAVSAGGCWVAMVDGQVVGFVVVEYTFFANGFISLLYIHPDFRLRGIGIALMRHVEAICKTDKLFTSTNQSNVPMQSLLKKGAYVRSGIIENLDEGDPELVYFKRLSKNP